MNTKEPKITVRISYIKIMFIYIILYMIIGGYLGVYAAGEIRSPSLAVGSFIVFIMAPLILSKRIQTLFTKEASFIFNQEHILIEIRSLKNNELEREVYISYSDIRACLISSVSPKSSTITIKSFSANDQQYSFSNENFADKYANEYDTNVAFYIYKEIFLHNSKVYLLKPFYASKNGLIAFVMLSALFIVGIIMSALYKPSLIFLSIIPTLALYIQTIYRRKRDIQTFDDYEKRKYVN